MKRLNLGCCDRHLPGYTNVDICPPADQIVDLSRPWPWEDNSVSLIYAADIFEHLPDKIHTMNETHRVLAPGGQVTIVVPTTDGRGAWQDPTHVSYWNRNTFFYFTVGVAEYERFHRHYGIKGGFKLVCKEEEVRTAQEVNKLTMFLEVVK